METISLSQLESHLWESANILRGPEDAANFKTYIFSPPVLRGQSSGFSSGKEITPRHMRQRLSESQ